MQDRFLILGCQRTGTTLMRLILEAHPEIFCYDELKGYAILQKLVSEDLPHVPLIGFKLPRWTEQLTHQVLFDEGLKGRCENFYRGEKILFLQRDVYDTIASMLKFKSGNSNWCEISVPRFIEAKLAHDETFGARYSRELDVIDGCHRRLVGLAALYWKYKTDSFFLYRDEGFPVLAVSYEQLVSDPRSVLQLVCTHLKIQFHENLLRHNEFRHSELFEDGLTVGSTDPARPIHADSVGQWQRFLTDKDLALIARVCGDLPERVSLLSKSTL
jgi:hypothetical protein